MDYIICLYGGGRATGSMLCWSSVKPVMGVSLPS